MVVGLFALSLVMIVGGIASVVQGFPYVRLESGLAMVISGATAASAGVILLGLSAVVQRLKRVEDAFRSARSGASAFADSPVMIPIAPTSAAPSLAGTAGLAGLTVDAVEPALDRFGGAHSGAASETSSFRVEPSDERDMPVEAEPTLPDLLPPGTPSPSAPAALKAAAREPFSLASAEEDLFVDEASDVPEANDKARERDDALGLRSSLDDAAAAEPSPPASASASEPKVVGTYSSGGNTYVMYADGIIEADTPRGRFTFNSLEELKAFVEAGGENDARGAA